MVSLKKNISKKTQKIPQPSPHSKNFAYLYAGFLAGNQTFTKNIAPPYPELSIPKPKYT